MLETPVPTHAVTVVKSDPQRMRTTLCEVLFWVAGFVLAFVIPLALVVGAILVSGYGIPLPIEVRVP